MKKFISIIFFLIFIITVILYFAGILSRVINPKFFWPLAFVGLGFPAILGTLTLFFLYWLFTKNTKLFYPLTLLILAAFVTPNIFNIQNYQLKAKTTDNTLKVMSYNVRNFEVYDKKNKIAKRDNIISLIKEQQPDILCLQEAYSREDFLNLTKVGKQINMPYHYFEVGTISKAKGKYGVAVFSKYPIKKTKGYQFSSGGNVGTKVDLDIENTTYSIFNIHLESVNIENKYYNYSSKEIAELSNKTLIERSKRVSRQLKAAFKKRAEQANLIRNEIKATKNPVIVCGDFNDTPISYSYSRVKGNLKDTFKRGKIGIGITYPAIPLMRIDHILTSPNINVINHSIIHKKISDHYPVIITIKK